MVPFYGQGLNCGLEDVRVLMSILRSQGGHQGGWARALERYSETRHEDLVAIRDMAMNN